MSTLGNNILMEYWRQNQIYGPTDGLVYYAPLDSYATHAVTGQAFLNRIPDAGDYTVHQGIRCCRIAQKTVQIDQTFSGDFTFSVWNYASDEMYNFAGWWISAVNSCFISYQERNMLQFRFNAETSFFSDITTDRTWHHFALIYGNGYASLYRDGVFIKRLAGANLGSTTPNIVPSLVGSNTDNFSAAARGYNRVLTDAEIATLASEFTPTA